MITAADFLKWLSVFGVPVGGGGGPNAVTKEEVQQSAFNYGAATGVNDAFIVDLDPPVTSLTNGLLVTMTSGSLQNLTTTPTLQINALSPVSIVNFAGNPAPGDIAEDKAYLFVYNAADNNFELLNPSITTADTFLVQQNAYNYATDAGTANAYVATVNPTPPEIDGGFPLFLDVAHNNTGASTLTVNGNEYPIVLSDNSALRGGELLDNQVAQFIFSYGYSAFILINPAQMEINDYMTWEAATSSPIAAVVQTGYTVTEASLVTINLPATCAVNDRISVVGWGAAGWKIQANTGQYINVGTGQSSEAGSVSSTHATDSIDLICTVTNTNWNTLGGGQGNFTLA